MHKFCKRVRRNRTTYEETYHPDHVLSRNRSFPMMTGLSAKLARLRRAPAPPLPVAPSKESQAARRRAFQAEPMGWTGAEGASVWRSLGGSGVLYHFSQKNEWSIKV